MSEPKRIATVNTEDYRLNFDFVDKNVRIPKKKIAEHDEDRLDFDIPLTEEAKRKGHTVALPISFFNIQYGDVEAGKMWYQIKFPKLSDDMCYLLARYNFGDLKYATKKSIRNNRKKYVKKHKEKQPIVERNPSKDPFTINWD